ncbi:MAG: hypothetical protein WBZ29_15725 [Methanocella sp.]
MMPAGDVPLTFDVKARIEDDASIARVFIAGEWQGDPEEAGALLETICRRWPKQEKVDFLVLCGGFLQFRWPDRLKRWDIGDNLYPSKDTVNLLYKEAEKCFRPVFDGRMRAKLRRFAGCVTFGIDSHYFRDSWWDPHVELVFALDLHSGEAWPTGKSYPNPRQQQGLVRIADLESHFIRAGGRDVVLLSCHDLSLFSPRSYHNARGWRRETIERFRQMARERRPELLIWHPHKSDTPRTWIPGLGGLRKELPGINYAGAGMYYNDGASPRASLDSVLKHTKNVPALDLIVKIKNEVC